MDKQLFDLLKTPQELNWLEAALIRDGIKEGPEFESAYGVSVESAKRILFAWEAAQSKVWAKELLCRFIDSEIFPDRRIVQLRIDAELPEKFTPANGLNWLKTEHIPIGDLDLWVQQNSSLSRDFDAAPPSPLVPATETKEQRQDRRLKACIDAGLPMDARAALSRLPDGVGDEADREGVTRQAFSTDVKAALKRRESAKREGVAVHRA